MSDDKTEGHTALPWRTSLTDDTSVIGADNVLVATTNGDYGSDDYIRMEANAALIVRAVNSFDSLVNELDVRMGDLVMLRKAIEAGDPQRELLIRIEDMQRETRLALARAKEQTP